MKRAGSWRVILGVVALAAAAAVVWWLVAEEGPRRVDLAPGSETAPILIDYPDDGSDLSPRSDLPHLPLA